MMILSEVESMSPIIPARFWVIIITTCGAWMTHYLYPDRELKELIDNESKLKGVLILFLFYYISPNTRPKVHSR